jgi:hypothetical protein
MMSDSDGGENLVEVERLDSSALTLSSSASMRFKRIVIIWFID